MRANIKITELNRCDSILSLCSHGYDHAITLQFNVMLNSKSKSKVRQDIDTFHDQWYQEARLSFSPYILTVLGTEIVPLTPQ